MTSNQGGNASATPADVKRSRWIILAVAAPVLLCKLWLAANTLGSNDILYWGDFVEGARQHGPVGIYALTWGPPWFSFYNHPPVTSYYLWAVAQLDTAGISYRFTIRAVSSLADVGSAYVLFALLRCRRSLREATLAGALVAASPALLWVSGYHGNTDPVFTFLTFLAVWLLVDSRQPGLAGAMIALAVGVKIIPVVVIPVLAVYAWRTRRIDFYRFAGGLVLILAVTWGPALISQFHAVVHDVLGYGGTGPSGWGILQLGHWLGDPWWVKFLAGPGRSLSVLVAAVVPAIAVWRRPNTIVHAVAWSLIAFLALAVSFGVQYSVWPLVACYVHRVQLGHRLQHCDRGRPHPDLRLLGPLRENPATT